MQKSLHVQENLITLLNELLQDAPNPMQTLNELIKMKDDPLWDSYEARLGLSKHSLSKSNDLNVNPGDILAVLGGC